MLATCSVYLNTAPTVMRACEILTLFDFHFVALYCIIASVGLVA